MLLPAGIALTCFVWVYADWLFSLLYHDTSEAKTNVLRLCLASLPAYFLTHMYGSVLTATNRLPAFIGVLVLAVVINVVLNLLLIPSYGAAGAAWAALGSQYLCAMGCMLACQPLVQLYPSRLLIYLAIAIALLLLFFFSKALALNVWVVLAIALILALVLVFARRTAIQKQLTPLQ
jgi:O-antigen/teichoic acid export membrane protein